MHHITTFDNQTKTIPTEITKKNIFHQLEDHDIHLEPETKTITVRSKENYINCETTGKVLVDRYLIKKDAPV